MNLLLSDDQVQIVDTLKRFLSEQAPVARFRPPASQIGNQDALLWPQIAELGITGMAVAESLGGIGLTCAEEMLACREFGRHLVSPAVIGLILAGHIAAATDNPALLAEIISGSARVGLANPLANARIGPLCGGTFHLIDSDDADWIVCCDTQSAVLLKRDAFDAVEDVSALDHSLLLQRARLESAAAFAWVSATENPIYNRALVMISAYEVGLAEATRDMAVEYAKVREQFGKPIGSFQAVKHICADMAIRAEAGLCQASFASLVLSESQPGASFHAVAGKLVCTDAALRNAAQNIQVHGAIGFTAEADAHLYLKRAHVMDQLWGDTRQLRTSMLDAPFAG